MSEPTGFQKAVFNAVREARKAGTISVREAMRVRAAVCLANIGRECQSLAETELEAEFGGLIDWDNFDVEKFAQLVAVVLQILAAFGVL